MSQRCSSRNALQWLYGHLKEAPYRRSGISCHLTKMTRLLTRLERHYKAILDVQKQMIDKQKMTRDVIYREKEHRKLSDLEYLKQIRGL
jgi:hypothetical protein